MGPLVWIQSILITSSNSPIVVATTPGMKHCSICLILSINITHDQWVQTVSVRLQAHLLWQSMEAWRSCCWVARICISTIECLYSPSSWRRVKRLMSRHYLLIQSQRSRMEATSVIFCFLDKQRNRFRSFCAVNINLNGKMARECM